MIESFAGTDAEKIWKGKFSKKLEPMKTVAFRKLAMVHAAHALDDLKSPPGNRLEALQGDRKGQHSIRMPAKKRLPLVHPGEVLRQEFLKPLGWSVNQLAKRLDVTAQRINEIVLERRGITADTALRLGQLFVTTPEFWMNLQTLYDLRKAINGNGESIKKRVHALSAR